MTDFTFQNKAYDLLLDLQEEGIIKYKPKPINDLKTLRLMIDVIKTAYPIYAEADNTTITGFIDDAFGVNFKEEDIKVASHEEILYRPVEIQEILPGVKLKIQENDLSYFHTFWTYEDTKKVIPSEDTSVLAYSRAFMYIWEKAKQGKVFIEHKFNHRIEDKVSHIDDPNSRGIIKGRKTTKDFKNLYTIYWTYVSDDTPIVFKQWDNEYDLINQTKLEALPMKTIDIVKKTKYNKLQVKVSYMEWDQEVYNDLINQYHFTPEQIAEQLPESGWVYKEKYITIGKNKQIDRELRVRFPKLKYKNVKILSTKISNKNFKHAKKNKIKPIEDKLICVKHFPSGYVSRILHSEAEILTKRNNDYGYVNKKEWRKCREEISHNKIVNKLNPIKPDKPVANYTTIGGVEGIGNSPIIGGITRRNRRANTKLRKHSHLIKEQKVLQIVPEVTENVRVTDSTWESPWANQIIKIVRPAHTILKRLLTRIQPHKEIKITEDVKLQRLERSAKDKVIYLEKKGLKSVSELHEEFKDNERRNGHYSDTEKWSRTFINLYELVTTGITEIKDKVLQVNKKGIKVLIDSKLKDEHHLQWDDSKIARFIRYLRLTTHGMFERPKVKKTRPEGAKKLSKIKKPVQSVEFEVVKTIQKIDYSKLKLNPPEDNKVVFIKFSDSLGEIEKVGQYKKEEDVINTVTGEFLCAMRDVIAWKYKEKDEYQDILIDEGGGITQVPIKYKRKRK